MCKLTCSVIHVFVMCSYESTSTHYCVKENCFKDIFFCQLLFAKNNHKKITEINMILVLHLVDGSGCMDLHTNALFVK